MAERTDEPRVLRTVPRSWFTSSFDIFDSGDLVAVLRFIRIRRKAEIDLQGRIFNARRKWLVRRFWLHEEGSDSVISEASRALFNTSFEVLYGSARYQLTPASREPISNFWLAEGERQVGSLYRTELRSREFMISIHPNIPLEVQLFVAWLAIPFWRTQQEVEADI